ncbi:MAG: chorismate synthase [Deltaproteobacteria bacterium]|nr:chorismate synthase [Deltaproteobacteria bacterium]
MPIRYLTAGESHGPALVAILEGLPAGCPLDKITLQEELNRRRMGVGRSHRMKLETDELEILSGVKNNRSLGSPITLLIRNKDSKSWDTLPPLLTPRPGHADLVGTLKFQHDDIRNTLERASARETAIRTAIGALCQSILKKFQIEFLAYVRQLGSIRISDSLDPWETQSVILNSPLLCPDTAIEKKMIEHIQSCQKKGDTVGGIFEIRVKGVPLGLGSFTQWDKRLDANIVHAICAIPAIKGVQIGEGFRACEFLGSQFQDEIYYHPQKIKQFGFYRKTNHSGGFEGGMTTGQDIVISAVMKPLSSLPRKNLNSIHLVSKKTSKPLAQRTDTCAVPAAAIVAKNVTAIEILNAFLEKFAGDSFSEVLDHFEHYLKSYEKNLRTPPEQKTV